MCSIQNEESFKILQLKENSRKFFSSHSLKDHKNFHHYDIVYKLGLSITDAKYRIRAQLTKDEANLPLKISQGCQKRKAGLIIYSFKYTVRNTKFTTTCLLTVLKINKPAVFPNAHTEGLK